MLRDRKQNIDAVTPLMKRLGISFGIGGFEMERLGAMLKRPSDGLGANSWNRSSSTSYGSVYSRTATTMRDLEARIGTPALERAFKFYYNRWKYRHPSIADFREALAEGSGQREVVEQVFAQQVYATQPVSDHIVQFISREDLPRPGYVERDGKPVELTNANIEKQIREQRDAWKKQHPDAKPGSGPFPYRTSVMVWRDGADVPQTLTVKFADGSSETVNFSGSQAWQRFSWVKPVKAVSAQLDPNREIFLDANKLDDGRTLKADGSAARRWASAAASLMKTFLALLVNL
jgi:hypothetical protein